MDSMYEHGLANVYAYKISVVTTVVLLFSIAIGLNDGVIAYYCAGLSLVHSYNSDT